MDVNIKNLTCFDGDSGVLQKTLLENVIQETTGSKLRALLNIKDQFELCQIKCRTSSSVSITDSFPQTVLILLLFLERPREQVQKFSTKILLWSRTKVSIRSEITHSRITFSAPLA